MARLYNPKATPIRGLTLTLPACAALLYSGQLSLALNVAVFALIVLYFLHSLIFLLLPRLNPELNREIRINIVKVCNKLQPSSLLSLGVMILIQLFQDFRSLRATSFTERVTNHSLTSIELLVVWSIVAAALYAIARSRARRDALKTSSLPAIAEVEGD